MLVNKQYSFTKLLNFFGKFCYLQGFCSFVGITHCLKAITNLTQQCQKFTYSISYESFYLVFSL